MIFGRRPVCEVNFLVKTAIKEYSALMANRPVSFINKQSKKEFEKLPSDARDDFAADFLAIQRDRRPFRDITPLQSVGKGVFELKINGSPAYRCVYVAKYADTIFILHSFEKTANGTDRKAMKTAEARYKLLKQEHKKPLSFIFSKALQLFSL